MKTIKKLSLVIPCYNEEKSLRQIVETALQLQEKTPLELVIVDDCSKDKSLDIARALQKKHDNIKLLQHSKNQGKGAALRTGFLHATGDAIGIQDADMEYDPLDYMTLLEPLDSGEADVVFGSRYLRPSNKRRVLYFWHTLMNKFLTFCSNCFTNLDITDMETCYKLFRRSTLQNIAPKLQENRFGFEPEITALIAQSDARVYECAINYNPRSYEEGKKITWKDGMRALYCILHYGAHAAPLPMQFIIYFFIGSVSALLNIVSFAVLYTACDMPLNTAIPASFLIAAAANYFLCIKILFQHKKKWAGVQEIVSYIVLVCFMGALDYGITVGLIDIHTSSMWSKFWAAASGLIFNFALRKYFVFSKKS